MADIFLFNGGHYKRGTDDGRVRVPLKSGFESQSLLYDPELQADAQSAQGGMLHMQKYAALFDAAAVDDAFYIHLVPDAMGVRGFWAAASDPMPGFKVEYDIVDIQKVYAAIQAGNLGSTVAGEFPAIAVDHSVGLGDAAYDAHLRSQQYAGTKFTEYRHPEAMTFQYLTTPVALSIGQACYIRMTIKELPTAVVADGCSESCSTCGGEAGWPRLQYGLVVDRTCFIKNEMRAYCRCNDPICAGCDSGADPDYE